MSADDWNQDQAWAEAGRRGDNSHWSDPAGTDWAEDVRSGAACQMTGVVRAQPQSGLGITALVLSLIAALLLLVPLGIGMALVAQNPNQLHNDARFAGLGCLLLLGFLLGVLAGIVGIVALFQPDRAKLCAVLGVIIASCETLGIVGLLVIGLLVG